jgi:predicted nucleic acid-binding protein
VPGAACRLRIGTGTTFLLQAAIREHQGHEAPRAEMAERLAAALDLAVENDISACDAQYLALARNLGVVCVSEDRQLPRRFPGLAVSMAAFCR